MRFFYLVLAVFISGCSGVAEKVEKIEEPRLIFLTEGIVGGISSPIVRQGVIFYQDALGKCQVWTRKLKEAPFQYSYYVSDYSLSQFKQLLSKLDAVKNLPLENPVGGEDIYELDTSLGVFSDQWRWMNQAPGGCVHMNSKTLPSWWQKRRFKEAVHLVKNELEILNLKETGKESYEEAFRKALKITDNYRIENK
ncbi:MAG: hypothetical protein R3F23_06600 [Verrucomicrobiia bacterium]